MKERAIYALVHDSWNGGDQDSNTEALVEHIIRIAESWTELSRPITENLALFNRHEAQLELQLIKTHNDLRVAEANLLFALVRAWMTVYYPPPMIHAFCSSLHKSPERVQETFFMVCVFSPMMILILLLTLHLMNRCYGRVKKEMHYG